MANTHFMRSVLILLVLIIAGCSASPYRESTGQYIDNSVITLKVKSALLRDPEIKSFPISVKSYKGTVQLSGFIDSRDKAEHAEAIARGIPGVKAVINDLVVK
ncbi:MAG: BON domain-containing protein [Gammaproteobacteria bacterium]